MGRELCAPASRLKEFTKGMFSCFEEGKHFKALNLLRFVDDAKKTIWKILSHSCPIHKKQPSENAEEKNILLVFFLGVENQEIFNKF